MGGLRCDYCGKDWVHPCWDADEAVRCGNLDDASVKRAQELAKSATRAQELREHLSRKPTAAEIEVNERKELARLKAKYET